MQIESIGRGGSQADGACELEVRGSRSVVISNENGVWEGGSNSSFSRMRQMARVAAPKLHDIGFPGQR
jgi:hypothetical protein